ncbi:hypothetical protein HDF12_003789 [Edaphobacter lichenicola]|uniref:Uncharacterized protein n=1 Tax=Tunturiibacter lichenicola TaxID=2051959 RepID=A0A7Y9NR63_9BACT|nr:hypothetical protein [Edaphobacter lichenicola]
MAPPNPELVLKLANDLVVAQKHLESLQAQWEALFSNSPTPSIRKPMGGIASRVLLEINQNPSYAFNVDNLHKIFGPDVDRKPIESALFNLHKANKIVRVTRGSYSSIKSNVEPQQEDMEDIFK